MFDSQTAGLALIEACRVAGPFNPTKIRGRGVWLEDDRVVLNFGQPVPADVKNRYICFEPISVQEVNQFETQRLFQWLELFNWRSRQDAMLLLGWLAVAPICGVLTWRPHCFVYGPPRCGKTTIQTLAAKLLSPLVISTDGQSTEAGIRQTLGADSLPVMIDEFESDQQGHGLRGVLRLARSASSADNPVLRGTPEGKAMQFSLRTTFFFSAINPRGMSAADESRILKLELLMHENDESVARKLIEEEQHFATRGPDWCGYMIHNATLIGDVIEAFGRAMPGLDRRHRQNITTLMAGAYVALNGRVPTEEEAATWAKEFAISVEVHAEALDRDDAEEALNHLLGHAAEGDTLGQYLGLLMTADTGDEESEDGSVVKATRIARVYDLVINQGDDQPGLYIRNQSPAMEKVFKDTRWAEGAWMTALRKLPGAFAIRNPIYFRSASGKCRAIGIPLAFIPEPEAVEEAYRPDREERF